MITEHYVYIFSDVNSSTALAVLVKSFIKRSHSVATTSLSQRPLFIISKLYLSLNYKFFEFKPRSDVPYVKRRAKNYEVRVGKQSDSIEGRRKAGARYGVTFKSSMRRKIWQNWNAHRRPTYGEHFLILD